MAAIYRCTGRSYTTDSLIHAVLYLEQVLTTGESRSTPPPPPPPGSRGCVCCGSERRSSPAGGGWQDQVGGLFGGVKVGRSRPSLPLRVEVERLRLSEDFLQAVEQRLLLVYTGKTRLARNLLQVRGRLRPQQDCHPRQPVIITAVALWFCRTWFGTGTPASLPSSTTPTSWCPTRRTVPEPLQTVRSSFLKVPSKDPTNL